MNQIRNIKGTRDILPTEIQKWQELEKIVHEVCNQFGYYEIRTPVFEETGLFLGAPGDIGETHNESWNQLRALGLAPNLAKLEYVGHAITPASKAFRFNARFFYAWESDMTGELGGSGELADLAFLDIEKALELPLVDVTQFMLEEIMRRKENGFATPHTYPFFGYRKDRQYQRYK